MPLAAKKGHSGRKTWKAIVTVEHEEKKVTVAATSDKIYTKEDN